LAFIGVLFSFQTQSRAFCLALAACLLFGALPGVLTGNVELYRILPLFPFLMILAAFGLASLTSATGGGRTLALLAFLAGSFSLDAYNYVFHYSDISKTPALHQWRNVQYHNAYEIVQKLSRETGPLYVFSEFNTDYDNKTLNIACYPFDALQNRSLSGSQPRWAIFILNSHYAPYFIRRSPGLKFKVLKTDKRDPGDPPPFGIFLLPVSQIPPEVLARWVEADQVYRKANALIKNKTLLEPWGSFPGTFATAKDRWTEDPLLTAVYWEKFAFFKYLSGDFKSAAEGFQIAVQRGIPAAHLYYDWGVSLNAMGKKREGEKALRKAEELSKRPVI
jgi:hypothetical protein